MSELNINDLPSEILTKVFRLLNEENLKSATLTCKLWNDLITYTCRWSLRLDYFDYGELGLNTEDKEQKMNFILTTNRKFGKITIDGCLCKDSEILKMFQKHGINVVELIVQKCRIDIDALAQLLHVTPNLKHATIDSTLKHAAIDSFHEYTVSNTLLEEALPDLKKLKSLWIGVMYEDQPIIKCFQKAKLSTIIIKERGRSEHYGPLTKFLSSQKNLTSLTVDISDLSILAEMGRLSAPSPFCLTKLVIFTCISEVISSHDHVMRFIKCYAENLTELILWSVVPNSVYEYVLSSMTKLKTLSVYICNLPRDKEFYERLKENRNVHKLALRDVGKEDVEHVGNFLKKLHNIRSIVLPMCGRVIKIASEMTQTLSKLESISLYCIDESLVDFDCMKFPNLRELEIEYLHVKINWNEFTKNNSRLAELTIQKISDELCLTSDDIDRVAMNVDLQSVRLGDGFVADDRFFEIVRTKCRNLKVLDLHKSCISTEINYNVEEINVLRLCDDMECFLDDDPLHDF